MFTELRTVNMYYMAAQKAMAVTDDEVIHR